MSTISNRIIFHIDVNSAFLSWTAIDELKKDKNSIDIRTIPSIIGGSLEDRKGVVLAKSIPAKKYNITTGEPIVAAIKKCPNLKIYAPNRKLYLKCSNEMYKLLQEYSSYIERYSIDEVFMEVSHFKADYMEKATEIKNRIERELGFAVNIGIGDNKLLAKMASDFPKKNAIHTLFKSEIKEKMWPMPIGELFMVGKAAEKKLLNLNICTIGDLAKYNLDILRIKFKSFADVIYNYANGVDNSEVNVNRYEDAKGIGNSTTTKEDIYSTREALNILLALTENVARRLRASNMLCSVVVVLIKTSSFNSYSHQKTLLTTTDSTEEIYKNVSKIFKEMWKGEPIRLLGVRVTKLVSNEVYQSSIFDTDKNEKMRVLDSEIDKLRARYGDKAIVRSSFLISKEREEINACVKEENDDYLFMGGLYDF